MGNEPRGWGNSSVVFIRIQGCFHITVDRRKNSLCILRAYADVPSTTPDARANSSFVNKDADTLKRHSYHRWLCTFTGDNPGKELLQKPVQTATTKNCWIEQGVERELFVLFKLISPRWKPREPVNLQNPIKFLEVEWKIFLEQAGSSHGTTHHQSSVQDVTREKWLFAKTGETETTLQPLKA